MLAAQLLELLAQAPRDSPSNTVAKPGPGLAVPLLRAVAAQHTAKQVSCITCSSLRQIAAANHLPHLCTILHIRAGKLLELDAICQREMRPTCGTHFAAKSLLRHVHSLPATIMQHSRAPAPPWQHPRGIAAPAPALQTQRLCAWRHSAAGL